MIERLPTELVCLIFLFSLQEFSESASVQNKSSTPLALGAVCRIWRTIVWSCPDLWASPSLSLRDNEAQAAIQVELLKAWLSRARDHPLSIRIHSDIDSDPLSQAFKVIEASAKLWQRLLLRIPSSAFPFISTSLDLPQLQSLVVTPPSPAQPASLSYKLNFPNTPQLRSAVLDCTQIYLRSLTLQWDGLSSISAKGLYVDECIQILRQAKQLVRGSFQALSRHSDGYELPSNPLILTALKYLDFDGSPNQITQLFKNILTPNASSFSFTYNNQSFITTEFCFLVQRSGSPLTHLSISRVPISEEDLMALLSQVPTLESFSIKMLSSSPLTDETLTELGTLSHLNHKLLPRLRRFDYVGGRSFSWNALFSMLESRVPRIMDEDPRTSAELTPELLLRSVDSDPRIPIHDLRSKVKTFTIHVVDPVGCTEIQTQCFEDEFSERIVYLRRLGVLVDIKIYEFSRQSHLIS